MTTAAIYARKSTDQPVPDEAKSVTRQIDHARAYATRKGWRVAEQHVYVDDGMSGADFTTRPGFLRLMNALKPRAPFQVLIMSEESRLGREQIETAYALKQIITAGARVFFYLEDRERTLENPTDKLLLSVTAFADELEREKARQRTADAMVRKARAGHVTGGEVFGYQREEVRGADGRRLHVVRKIDPHEAPIVRRIFQEYADGVGLKRLADRLNRDRAPAPKPRKVGRPAGWAPSTIREMLRRALYVGRIDWNRTKKRDQWGIKREQARPEAEWITTEAPELRIVDDDLWWAVQARRNQAAQVPSGADSRFVGVPRGRDSKYLLTGFATCATCGGTMGTVTRPHGSGTRRRRAYFYGCMTRSRRGGAVCQNATVIPQDVLDRALLQAISDILDQRIIAAAVEQALEMLRDGQERQGDRRTQIERELSLIVTKEQRLVDAIGEGGDAPEPLVAALKTEGARKKDLARELEALGREADVRSLDRTRLKKDVESRAADVRALLGRQTAQARQMLRKLLVGPLRMEPVAVPGARRAYCFKGTVSIARLFSGTACEITRAGLVAPTGFEPVFQP